jgi:hypothetical protein
MPIKTYLTEEEAWRVIGFLQNCLSQLKVSAQFAISQTIIRCLWTSYGQTNSINQRQKGGELKVRQPVKTSNNIPSKTKCHHIEHRVLWCLIRRKLTSCIWFESQLLASKVSGC